MDNPCDRFKESKLCKSGCAIPEKDEYCGLIGKKDTYQGYLTGLAEGLEIERERIAEWLSNQYGTFAEIMCLFHQEFPTKLTAELRTND